MTRRTRAAGLLAAAAVLGLAGCGGADWPTAGAPSASATPSATAAAAPAAVPASGSAGGSDPGDAGSGGGGGAEGTGARCTTAELRGSLGEADGAAGSVNQTLVLTNVGGRTCSLRGFPGLSYVGGDDGRQVGPSAVMSGPRGGDVRLVPGGSSGAEMQLLNVRNVDPATCRPTPVRGLRVYPPGDTASLFVPRAGTGCAGALSGGSSQLSIQTVRAR